MRDEAARATNERAGIHGKILHRRAVNSDLITLFFPSTARGRTPSEAAPVSAEPIFCHATTQRFALARHCPGFFLGRTLH
jgi:hypothetical protein